MLNKLIPDYK